MAFREIASTSTASTSSSTKPFYDVFINHRGKDTKHKLASTIYNMLDLMGVRAFLDQEELEKGDSFPEAIEEAMRTASVHIAIFSPGYVESPWCLEELSFMLRIKVTIIPVFYDVDPSHLRFVRKGIYADKFGQHEKKLKDGGERRYKPEKINEWEEALRQVSYLSGFTVDGDKCDQGKLLREILKAAIDKIKKLPLQFARSPIGLDEAVKDFESKVRSSTGTENVNIVGIVGMGGSGKTTLATELYNRKCSSISRSCFLSKVRDAASAKTLHELQKKLLTYLRIQHPAFDNIDEGMGVLAKNLISMAVLIVLDDVDDVDQMDALLPDGMMHNLGQGSFIIVTTREVEVLTSLGISSIYHMKPLDTNKAKQLFCRHAFLKDLKPRFENMLDNYANFENLIERFVKACDGLPLSLKVLGAMMNGKSKAYWQSQLDKMSTVLPSKIVDCLKVSYEALDTQGQQMFLDVACFFIGGEKSMVVAIWDGSGWSGEVGWETLINKCLVGLDEEGRIDMHDHLRDLGRQISRDVSPSRIWKKEQISIQDERTLIRGIAVGLTFPNYDYYDDDHYSFNICPPPLEHFMEIIINGSSSPKLQLLSVKGNDFKERFAVLSRDLVWLRWHDFEGTNLPSWLSLANLSVLELYRAKNLEELWKDNVQTPLQLRELIIDISGKACFRGLPRSIGRLKHLKKIVLNGNGSGMRRLPEEFGHLESLEFLQLSNFPELSSLPHDFCKLKNLRNLRLCRVQLTALPDSSKQLTALQTLQIDGSESFMFSSEMLDVLEFMTQLQILDITKCPQLEELPRITYLVSLRELILWDTGLRELPNNIGQLTKLENIIIASYNLTTLPESVGALPCLNSLEVQGGRLRSLPESLGALSSLTFLQISGFELRRFLRSYFRGDSGMLECLPETLGRLSNLQELTILNTPLVEEIGFLGIGAPSGCNLNSLKRPCLKHTGVWRISISDDCCPNLETLILHNNGSLIEIETLPGNVREIKVCRCHWLKSLRVIGGLLKLESLEVVKCLLLEVVPCPPHMRSVGHTITIRDCPFLEDVYQWDTE